MARYVVVVLVFVLASCSNSNNALEAQDAVAASRQADLDTLNVELPELDAAIQARISTQSEASSTGPSDIAVQTYQDQQDADEQTLQLYAEKLDTVISSLEANIVLLEQKIDDLDANAASSLRDSYESYITLFNELLQQAYELRDVALVETGQYLSQAQQSIDARVALLADLDAAVTDADALLSSLQSQADSIVLIAGAKGDAGDQGPTGDKGPTGDIGLSFTVDEIQALQATVAGWPYVSPTTSVDAYRDHMEPPLRSAQGKLQALLDVIERIQVGNSIDTSY